MKLSRSLRVAKNVKMALVGSGGKTTALFQLARELLPPVLVTTSTHLGEWQLAFADRHWIVTRPEDVARFAGQIEGVTLFTGPPSGDQRVMGLDADSLAAVDDLANMLGFPVLVEADGSRQRPLKAPGDDEPVIPSWVNQVVVTAGLLGLNQPLDASAVHRTARFAEISGLRVGEPVSEDALARALLHPRGGLKAIPERASRTLLLNQAGSEELIIAGMRIAKEVLGTFHSILVANLIDGVVHAVVEPTAGIILAAGGSKRFGQAKMLLPWRGKPLVRHAAETALAAGLDPVVVISGAEAEGVRLALTGLDVRFAENPDWASGQSTSVRRGIESVGDEAGSAIFLLADQPFATPGLLLELIKAHQRTLSPVIAPRVEGRRANPVLFDRDTFADLAQLSGDTGGRAIFDRYGVEYLDWDDPKLLLDVDTPDDYHSLQELE
jgi:molybdenum cofactor cytidylyltransferase